MFRHSFFELIFFIVISGQARSAELTLVEAKNLAEEYVKKELKNNSQIYLRSERVGLVFKKNYLIRVMYLGTQDLPAYILAVTSAKQVISLSQKGDIASYFKDMNFLSNKESLKINSEKQAKIFFMNLMNIYGIYKAELDCFSDFSKSQFRCKVSRTSPREFDGEVVILANGKIEQTTDKSKARPHQ